MSLLSKFAPALVVLAVAPASMAGISDLAKKTEPTKESPSQRSNQIPSPAGKRVVRSIRPRAL